MHQVQADDSDHTLPRLRPVGNLLVQAVQTDTVYFGKREACCNRLYRLLTERDAPLVCFVAQGDDQLYPLPDHLFDPPQQRVGIDRLRPLVYVHAFVTSDVVPGGRTGRGLVRISPAKTRHRPSTTL